MRPVVVLDFGGQYAHLIANRIRRLGVYSELKPPDVTAQELKALNAAGIILSGGGGSVYGEKIRENTDILRLGIPVLGICYGMQWIAYSLGGQVKPGPAKEYGATSIDVIDGGGQLLDVGAPSLRVWMSHGDEVDSLPPGFRAIAQSVSCRNAAMENVESKIWGVQFHPEVTHTQHGLDILQRFLGHCTTASKWSVREFASRIEEEIQSAAGASKKVFILVSGGVDSTVAYTLLQKVLGKERVYGLLVDTGLMRQNEAPLIQSALASIGFANLHVKDASATFLERLKEIYAPEEKRKVIGSTFLDVKDEVAKEMKFEGHEWLLGQGTIYPDTIETGGTKHAAVIKTHHNRIDAITELIKKGLVIEPLKDLYKDEVRELGRYLGLPEEVVMRHPFPGPGLGVRILCAKEPKILANERAIEETVAELAVRFGVPKGHLACRVLPVKSVGVQGDSRSYRHAIALFLNPNPFLESNQSELIEAVWKLATFVPNQIGAINRVLLCCSHTLSPPFVFTDNSYITRERVSLLASADFEVDRVIREQNLYGTIWQFPVALLPFGAAAGNQSIVLRPVDSSEAMTANASRLGPETLGAMVPRILAIPGLDIVFYDLTSKPPGTIEWE